MSKKAKARKNPLAGVDRADRTRKIMIQVGVAVVLIGLIAAIGISIAVKKSNKENPDPEPNAGAQTTAAIAADKATLPDGATATITDTGAIRIGRPDAKVTVRVVEDLQCPACQGFEQANHQAIEDAVASGSTAIEYNIVAFLDRASTTNYSSRAANAAYCVAGSDPSKFQKWLASMFEQQPPEGTAGLPNSKLKEIAKAAGYTDSSIEDCITDRKFNDYIQKVSDAVSKSGVQSTPTIYVNGQQVDSKAIFSQAGGFIPGAMTSVIAAATAQ